MSKIARPVILLAVSILLMGCFAIGGASQSLAKKDLSKVVLQLDEVPEAFSNPSIYGEEGIKMFFPLSDGDKIDAFSGVSYLNPQNGINMIYSVVVVLDDVESAQSVYANVSGQVNTQLHLLKDEIGEESLLFKTLSGTSFFSIWRYLEAVGYVAVTTKRDVGFGYKEVLAASKLMQKRLEE